MAKEKKQTKQTKAKVKATKVKETKKVNKGTPAKPKQPSKIDDMQRVVRAIGQLNGITKMMEAGRSCADIIIQLQAVRASVKIIEGHFLEKQLRESVEAVIVDEKHREKKLEELLKLFDRSAL